MELAGNYKRYHCPLSRTLIIGEAPQKVKDLAAVVVEGLTEALEFVKPGVTCEEVERVWAKSIEKKVDLLRIHELDTQWDLIIHQIGGESIQQA